MKQRDEAEELNHKKNPPEDLDQRDEAEKNDVVAEETTRRISRSSQSPSLLGFYVEMDQTRGPG